MIKQHKEMDVQTGKSLHRFIKDGDLASLTEHLNGVQNVSNFHRGSEPLLHAAIASGNIDMVKLLLSKSASCNSTNSSGHKALHCAAKFGNVGILDYILRIEGDIMVSTDTGDTALYVAVANEQIDAVDYLLQHGIDVNQAASFLYSRNTPLHKAAGYDDVTILNLLLGANADVSKKNDDKQTALHLAAAGGKTACVDRLLSCGARVDELDSTSNTPLQLAISNGHGLVVNQLCVAGASMNLENRDEESCFKSAVLKRNIHVVKTLLHFGANVNRRFNNGRTALHTALEHCPHSMRTQWKFANNRLSVNNEIEMLDALIQAGADLNIIDSHMETPLHLCIRSGCSAALEYLIKTGANYMTINRDNYTPLITSCMENVTPATKLILQHCPGLVNHPVNQADLTLSPMLILAGKGNMECIKMMFSAGYHFTEAEMNTILLSIVDLEDNQVPAFRGGRGGRGRGRGRGGKTVSIAKQKNKVMINDILDQEFSNPWSLERTARTTIRNLLKDGLSQKVMYLPLPQKMRNSIWLGNSLWV